MYVVVVHGERLAGSGFSAQPSSREWNGWFGCLGVKRTCCEARPLFFFHYFFSVPIIFCIINCCRSCKLLYLV